MNGLLCWEHISCSQGAFIDDSGFTVTTSTMLVEERIAKLNESGVVYAYIMFR